MTPTETDWKIRLYLYQALSTSGSAPDAHAVAANFRISPTEARQALERLHDAHTLVLSAGSNDILMAHPLSAVPTDYRVLLGDLELYANCAWDSLGIPTMLGQDANIKARHPLSGECVTYAVEDGQLIGHGSEIVHFALPFRQWYDDIVDT